VSGSRYRLTPLADADIAAILEQTYQEFGARQFESYWALIDKASRMVGADPTRPSSRTRDELAKGVRSFHVALASRRRSVASHVLYYIPREFDDGALGALILRVLWDGMAPGLHIAGVADRQD
jgi:toxin ParE1/3/4